MTVKRAKGAAGAIQPVEADEIGRKSIEGIPLPPNSALAAKPIPATKTNENANLRVCRMIKLERVFMEDIEVISLLYHISQAYFRRCPDGREIFCVAPNHCRELSDGKRSPLPLWRPRG
jgi:hypothetical protein